MSSLPPSPPGNEYNNIGDHTLPANGQVKSTGNKNEETMNIYGQDVPVAQLQAALALLRHQETLAAAKPTPGIMGNNGSAIQQKTAQALDSVGHGIMFGKQNGIASGTNMGIINVNTDDECGDAAPFTPVRNRKEKLWETRD